MNAACMSWGKENLLGDDEHKVGEVTGGELDGLEREVLELAMGLSYFGRESRTRGSCSCMGKGTSRLA